MNMAQVTDHVPTGTVIVRLDDAQARALDAGAASFFFALLGILVCLVIITFYLAGIAGVVRRAEERE